jgi:phage I-like protein
MNTRNFILLDIAPGPQAPTEVRLFRAGANETRKGVFLFNERAAVAVLKAAADWGVRLSFDYGHAMLDPWAVDPANAGRSAGSFVLEVRAGALWAADIKWTPAAKAAIEAREWLYISPAFNHEPDGTVTEVLNVALTNMPATKNLDPLMALAERAGREPPKGHTMKGILAMLSLAETASEGEAVAALQAKLAPVAELMSVTGKATAAEALGVARAGVDAIKRVEALGAELVTARQATLAATVEDAVKAGKLAPAMRAWALDYGARDPGGFAAYLSAAVAVVPLDGKPAAAPAAPGATVTLSDSDLAVCRQLGIKPADFAAIRAPGA